MSQEVILESVKFEFSQEGNCVDQAEYESIEIEMKSDLGIDRTEGCFYVIKTEQWSVDSIEDFQKLIERMEKVLKK